MTDRDPQDDNETDDTQTHPIDPPVPDEQRYRLETDTAKSKGADAGRRKRPEDDSSDDPTLPSNDATLRTKI
jgi:hypothetical protein